MSDQVVSDALVPCFKCGKTVENVMEPPDAEEGFNQPYGATEFETPGHYGSTFWDPFDGSTVVINICDDCLRANVDKLAIRRPIRQRAPKSVTRLWEEAQKPYEDQGEKNG